MWTLVRSLAPHLQIQFLMMPRCQSVRRGTGRGSGGGRHASQQRGSLLPTSEYYLRQEVFLDIPQGWPTLSIIRTISRRHPGLHEGGQGEARREQT
jgi:hypothetical protein